MHNLINNTVFKRLIFWEDTSLKLFATVTTHKIKKGFSTFI